MTKRNPWTGRTRQEDLEYGDALMNEGYASDADPTED